MVISSGSPGSPIWNHQPAAPAGIVTRAAHARRVSEGFRRHRHPRQGKTSPTLWVPTQRLARAVHPGMTLHDDDHPDHRAAAPR
jgi:hypothetical protein